jgi:uncharacterized integral membrane protein
MNKNPGESSTPRTPAPVPQKVRHTRLGGLWILLALGAAVLVLLLVFILMNTHRVQINIYGAHVTIPLGVALLLAAALGVLLVVVPGGGRIIQLKRAARRLHKEREHLAGRLDEVSEATDAGTAAAPDGAAAQAPAQQPATTQPAAAQPPAEQSSGKRRFLRRG